MIRSLVQISAVFWISVIAFLSLDFAYSTLIHDENAASGRVKSDAYAYGLAPNYAGLESWGRRSYQLVTNSLGFKDAAIRDVPLAADVRRILVIGDSFTEGIGLRFDETYVGMLHRAGQESPEPVEFLNAGANGYSVTLYYRKIEHLLQNGLEVDEVLVALSASDIPREAAQFFCFDPNPDYAVHCDEDYGAWSPVPVRTSDSWGARLQRHFVVTDRTRIILKDALTGPRNDSPQEVLKDAIARSIVTGWPTRTEQLDPVLQPLGIAGGIRRAQENMTRLADLLSAHGIDLSVSVHPWPVQLFDDDRNSPAVSVWRDFCELRCKSFISVFPAFFDYKDRNADWYRDLFIYGDYHYSKKGNEVMFEALRPHFLP